MTDSLFTDDDSSTPLEHEELEGLIPSYITLRRELNEAEQQNIAQAQTWAMSRKSDVLDIQFLLRLHKRMFQNVWKWAAQYRTTARNIGVDAWKISTELRQLLDDTKYWIDNEVYSREEIAVRFHHKLVWIHPFPNGNGRHARLATDLLLTQLGCDRFTWGSANLISTNQVRQEYINALRAADQHDYEPLKLFVRS